MKLFLKILFILFAIFSANISEAKVFDFSAVISERISAVKKLKINNDPTEISENDFMIISKRESDLIHYRNLVYNFTNKSAPKLSSNEVKIKVFTT